MNRNYNNSRVPRANARPGPNPPQPAGAPAPQHRNRPLCRTSDYKPPGSKVVGLSGSNQPSKVVWELDYGLNDVQFKALSQRFPGIAFVQTGFDCHDHPIAHTSYRVVWENVVRKLKPGAVVADIAGNPTFNERYNQRQVGRNNPIKIDTFCKVQSTKDSVRSKTRWGPNLAPDGSVRWDEMTLYDMYRNEENRERFAKYDVFLMNHVLYYYTFAEINRLMQLNPEAVLVATLHKLEGQKGTINCGEQSYCKDFSTGKVTQVNVETGEDYKHPDPAPWFSDFCYADEHGAMAWTITKGCDDTYIVTLTSSLSNLVPESCWLNGEVIFKNEDEVIRVKPVPVVADPPPAYAVEEVKLRTSDLIPGYHLEKQKIVKITHPELYEALRAFMINKPRNMRTLGDLTAKAHREAGNNTLLGNNKKVKISSDSLTEHIAAAWSQGAALEASMLQYVSAGNPDVAALNRGLSGNSFSFGAGNAVKQIAKFALLANGVARSREPVVRVLEHLDDLF